MHRRLMVALSAALVLSVAVGAEAQPDGRDRADRADRPRRGSRDGAGPGLDRPAAQGNRPGGPHKGRRSMGRRGAKLTAEQEAELLAILKDRRPDFYQRLTRLGKENHRAYRRTLSWAWRWYQRWKRMSKEDKESVKAIEEARRRMARVLRAIRESKQPPTAEQKRELLQAVTKAFEAEQALQASRIEKLEKEIQRIKEEMRNRFARREELIAERVKQMFRTTTQPARRPGRNGRGPTTPPGKQRPGRAK